MRPRILQLTATAALAVGLTFSAAPAFAQAAGDFEKGVEAFDLGKYKDAIALWEPLADEGNVEALRNLAQLHRLGLGVQQDDKKAFELYERAAKRGLAAAQVNAAFLLLTGKGVEQDRAAAATWFAKAADQGDPLAQYNLGLMYEKGIGVRRNDEFALELYRLAADQGQRRAIARLDAMESAEDAKATRKAEAAAAGSDDDKAEAETAKADAPKPVYVQKETAEKEDGTEKAEVASKADDEKAMAKADNDDDGKSPALSIKPLKIEPLEFEAIENAGAPDATKVPTYKPEAEQNDAEVDERPIVNVVRTPMRKPGDVVEDAPKGDEPTPIYIQKVTVDKGDETKSADAETDGASDATPTPAYTAKYDASESAADTKAPASVSTSEMRAPSDPVARVKMAERAYRVGDYDSAARLLSPLSDAGMPVAQFWMGRLYNRGEGVDLNRVEAYSLWRSAAAGGSSQAATALANLASRLSADEIAVAEQRHAASGRAR